MTKIALCDARGPLAHLIDNLSGEQGDYWNEALKRFLRKENPWAADCGGVSHVVDTDTLVLPEDVAKWRVIEHLRQGKRTLDRNRLALHRESEQTGSGCVGGHELRKRLTGKPQYLGLCELLCLKEHPELIPDSWKEVVVYGWNTILESPDGSLCVPCLDWYGGEWIVFFGCLVGDWYADLPAGSLASQ